MVNANADALGIIFPNSYDEQVPDLVNERRRKNNPDQKTPRRRAERTAGCPDRERIR